MELGLRSRPSKAFFVGRNQFDFQKLVASLVHNPIDMGYV